MFRKLGGADLFLSCFSGIELWFRAVGSQKVSESFAKKSLFKNKAGHVCYKEFSTWWRESGDASWLTCMVFAYATRSECIGYQVSRKWLLIESCEETCRVCRGRDRYVEKLLFGDAERARDVDWLTCMILFVNVLPAASASRYQVSPEQSLLQICGSGCIVCQRRNRYAENSLVGATEDW